MGEYTTINPSSKEKRREHDLYPTPEGAVRAILKELYNPDRYIVENILDPGCGNGVWGRVAREFWPNANIVGVEIRKDQENLGTYNSFYNGEDYLANNSLYPRDWQLIKYDLIIGNPPYFAAEEFIRTSRKYIASNGQTVFLLRQAFLASMKRYNGLWKDYLPDVVWTLSRRPSFYHADTGKKSTDGEEYAAFMWRSFTRNNRESYTGKLLNWEY